ncbi:MAG: hypothetical protein ACR2QQ_01740 [Gammaproteobacteria bacterium]
MRRRVVLAAVLGTALVSCTGITTLKGYSGPPLPEEETILIYGERPASNRLAANVVITAHDTPIGDLVPVNAHRVRLLPGEVCVQAEATTSTMDQEEALMCFDALEGHEYEIRVQVRGVERDLVDSMARRRTVERGPFRITGFWIVDAGSSEIVASYEPIAIPGLESD